MRTGYGSAGGRSGRSARGRSGPGPRRATGRRRGPTVDGEAGYGTGTGPVGSGRPVRGGRREGARGGIRTGGGAIAGRAGRPAAGRRRRRAPRRSRPAGPGPSPGARRPARRSGRPSMPRRARVGAAGSSRSPRGADAGADALGVRHGRLGDRRPIGRQVATGRGRVGGPAAGHRRCPASGAAAASAGSAPSASSTRRPRPPRRGPRRSQRVRPRGLAGLAVAWSSAGLRNVRIRRSY